ncbi:MAG: ATP-binding cassette domain-containing protein [Bacteroidetes bacterium]|nr:MAG: ATP-binding cassette domain-containing protein [Bacteroidota bacterium]
MNIRFEQVMPFPLSSIKHGEESIWGNKVRFDSGEKVILNASSGKGKSTFTMTTLGLRHDYSGNVFYNDNDIRNMSYEDWTDIRQTKISVVFQDLQLFPKLTVRENLKLKNDLSPVYTEEELRSLLNELGIADKWDQECGILSMGQQQRVAIIRALAQPFEWILLDEPFSHLDEENTQKCLTLIHQRCDEQNAGFILTTLGDDHGTKYDREQKL